MSDRTITQLLNEKPIHIADILEWMEKEYRCWNRISDSITYDSVQVDGQAVSKYLSMLGDLLVVSDKNREFDFKALEHALSIFGTTLLPHHDDAIIEKITQPNATPDKIKQILLFYTISRSSLESVIQKQYESRYEKRITHAVEQLEDISNNYTKTHQIAMTSIEKGRKKLEDLTEALVSEMNKDIKSYADDEKNRISELSASIQKEIRSNEPVKFWEGKEAHHRSQAKSCRWVAIFLGFCASIALALLMLAAFKDQDTTTLLGFKLPNHFYIAVSILIGSAFIWALKVSIQLMMTHIALEAEALEKSTAIKTYVALSGQIKDPDIDKEFHKSLLSFSKIKIAEDSNHPDLVKLIEQFLNKKKDSN